MAGRNMPSLLTHTGLDGESRTSRDRLGSVSSAIRTNPHTRTHACPHTLAALAHPVRPTQPASPPVPFFTSPPRRFTLTAAMDILLSITIFVAFGAAFVFANLVVGAVARPRVPNPEKSACYECGEPAIGSS